MRASGDLRVWLYHKEYAPKGRLFNLATAGVSLDTLVKEGWVDNPGKFGVNIWGGNPREMDQIRQAFESGEIKAIDDIPTLNMPDAERSALERENSALHERLKVQEDEIEALKRAARESREELADAEAEAAKVTPKRGRTQVQVPRGGADTDI